MRKNENWNEVLAGLQVEYLKDLERRVQLMKSLWSADDRTELHREFHKLKGTGKTYGFEAISDLCALLEDATEQKVFPRQGLFEGIELLDSLRISLTKSSVPHADFQTSLEKLRQKLKGSIT